LKKIELPRGLVGRIVCCSAVLLICFILKKYYSSADSQSLIWILAPTAHLVELFSGLAFVNEPGLGWFNQLHEVLIAPSCGGVNFLIIIFCMSSFQIISSQAAGSRVFFWAGCAGVAAYAVTLLVNSLRIWLSILLLQADIYSGWLTPEAIHRIGGVTLYYLVLCFYYLFISSMLNRHAVKFQTLGIDGSRRGRIVVLCVPLAWYLLFALGVPFVNNAYQQQPDLFVDHSLAVGSTSVVLTIILTMTVLGFRTIARLFRNRFVR
jgi:exosortase K